ELIMFDEPSLGLAPTLVQELFRAVRALNERGLTVLLVEQNVVASLKLAKRAYVLENGSIVMRGTGAELIADDRVRQAYLGVPTSGRKLAPRGGQQGIEHHAHIGVADAPIVGEWTTFAAKTQPLYQADRGGIVGMNQGLHAAHAQVFKAVGEERAHGFGHETLALPLRAKDVAHFQPAIVRLAMVVVDHA